MNDSQIREFKKTWSSVPGTRGWFMEVNNQPLGKRFMATAFVFFALGGILALLMRVQLAAGDLELIGPQRFNQFFTMHGSTMMYLFSVPFLEGLALYLLPLMIGSRDAAFPRLTAFSYWAYLFGGVLFYSSFFVGAVPDAGWFAYTPLSGPRYSGLGVDFWLLGLSLVEVAGIAAGVEIVVTVLKFRAPGMTISRMPLLIWTLLVVGIMILIAFTVLLMATLLLELDRAVGTRFFDPSAGGSTLLWQHLFWFFGHPEVYIMFLPATGIVSMVVATFARRKVTAYRLVVVAIVLIGFVSFGLWVHHIKPDDWHCQWHSDLLVDRHAVGNEPAVAACISLDYWVHRGVCVRWTHRRDGCRGAVRYAGARHLLYCGSFSLCPDRWGGFSDLRGPAFLAAKDHGKNDVRTTRALELLADVHRL
jgi:cytochrome c oxidase subunit I+III